MIMRQFVILKSKTRIVTNTLFKVDIFGVNDILIFKSYP